MKDNQNVREKLAQGVVQPAESLELSPDPISGVDPKEHGCLTLSDLFKEIRSEEAAGKREDAHLTPQNEKTRGIER